MAAAILGPGIRSMRRVRRRVPVLPNNKRAAATVAATAPFSRPQHHEAPRMQDSAAAAGRMTPILGPLPDPVPHGCGSDRIRT